MLPPEITPIIQLLRHAFHIDDLHILLSNVSIGIGGAKRNIDLL